MMRPGNWAARYGDPRLGDARKTGVLNGVRFMEPPYSARFPELARMLEEDPSFPKGNILRRNTFWRGSAANLRRLNWENPPESKAWRQEEWWYHVQQARYMAASFHCRKRAQGTRGGDGTGTSISSSSSATRCTAHSG